MAGADRVRHIGRVAADSKSASSLRSLPQLLLNFQFKFENIQVICKNLKTLLRYTLPILRPGCKNMDDDTGSFKYVG